MTKPTLEEKLEVLETARRKAVAAKNEAEKDIIGYSKRIRKIKREIRDAQGQLSVESA